MTEKTKKIETKVKVPIITQIQNELKAPKNQWNNFGKYNYRNAEDIESALKPLLAKYGAQLTFDEQYRQLGNRIYAVEIANYKDSEQEISVQGWAREPEHKKGMDESQISGSTSSYAIKNVLGKLFLIDDTKDADSQKPQEKQKAMTKPVQQHKFTEDEITNFSVDYKPTMWSNPRKMIIAALYLKAEQGDKLAANWWKENRKNNTLVGQALRAYEELVPTLKKRSSAKQKELQESMNKIKEQSNRNQAANMGVANNA